MEVEHAKRFVLVLGLAASLAACAGSPDGMGPGPKENTGTLLGAGSGALLGAAVAGGGTGNRLAGAAIGGLLGGLIGNRIGASLDDEDRERAYAAQMDALERGQSGAPVSWKNPDLGPLRYRGAGADLCGKWPQLPLLHPHYLYRRAAADRPRHRLPQSGRQLDRAELRRALKTLHFRCRVRLILLNAATIARDVCQRAGATVKAAAARDGNGIGVSIWCSRAPATPLCQSTGVKDKTQ